MLNNKDIYAAFFRVAISILLLVDVLTNLIFSQDLYNLYGYKYSLDSQWHMLAILRENISIFLFSYAVFLILFLLGIGKNLIALVVFLYINLDFWLMYPANFWGDYVLKISMLYFVFVDSFQYFALEKTNLKSGIISQLAVLAIMLNVCLIYISNAYFKVHNPEWNQGTAIAYFFNFSEVLDIHHIGKVFKQYPKLIELITLSILFFQITFPIFVWFKKLKWIWIFAGILIHAIMAVTLQLYKFEIIVILLYGFFITDEEWRYISKKLNLNYAKR